MNEGQWQARRYVGTDGVYTHTVAYERDAACPMCSAGAPFPVHASDTLQQARPPHPCHVSALQQAWALKLALLVATSSTRQRAWGKLLPAWGPQVSLTALDPVLLFTAIGCCSRLLGCGAGDGPAGGGRGCPR